MSWMGVPMVAAGRVVGVVAMEDEHYAYTGDDLAVLATVAAQAAVAIANARLFQESRRRSENLAVLFQAGTVLVSTLDLREVYEAVCREAAELLDGTSAYVSEWDEGLRTSTGMAEYYGPEASPEERVSDLGVAYPEVPSIA